MAHELVVNIHSKQKFDVYVGRPSKWGNPFLLGADGPRDVVVARYREWLLAQPHLVRALPELRGKRLGCYCAPLPCHADVLADLASKRRQRDRSVDGMTMSCRTGFRSKMSDARATPATPWSTYWVKGMVMLSGYDCALYARLYGDWQRMERATLADGARPRTECLWFNAAAWAKRPQAQMFEG